MLNIKIKDLPTNISLFQAVESCYSEQIRFVCSRLAENMSVIIRCDKQILPYLQSIIRKKLQVDGKTSIIVDGRSDDIRVSRISNIVAHLRQLLNNTETNSVFMLPYLDIITSTNQSGLSMEGKEIMTLIHENPFLTLLAFEDIDFPIPTLINQAFPAKTEMIGINRNKLKFLITHDEARKFSNDEINLMQLYRYVSGLNPVKFRQIMSVFSKKVDFDYLQPDMLKEYFRELRTYTTHSGDTLSSVNLNHDIAGYETVKDKINENILGLLSIAYNSNDEAFISHIEDIIPKGIIFYGPPGTGKTLFAKGIAEAINATVYIISGPELKSKWVGEGEANIRRLFARARATAPSVIVFDEFDSVAPARTSGAHDGAMESSHSMVNQLLTEMDGFRKEELVFVIGTTNFPQALDPALLRPGRFEYQIEIPFPEWEDRKAILNLYNLKHRTELSKENIETLTSWTERLFENSSRYTGDHLDALIRSLKRYLINKKLVKLDDEGFNTWLKLQTKTHTLTNDEEKVIAIHEAGHTMMYRKYNRLDEVKKVTIESGITDVLGMVEINIKENHNFYTENDLRSNIAIALGGYVAEKIIFTQVSTGSYNDLSSATKIAEDMVVFYGMGNLNVPRNYGDQEGKVNPFFNNLISPQIDAILLEIKEEVINYLNENKSLLQLFADLLIQKRTLNPDEIKEILGKQV